MWVALRYSVGLSLFDPHSVSRQGVLFEQAAIMVICWHLEQCRGEPVWVLNKHGEGSLPATDLCMRREGQEAQCYVIKEILFVSPVADCGSWYPPRPSCSFVLIYEINIVFDVRTVFLQMCVSLPQVRLEWPTDLAINPLDNSLYILDNNIVLQVKEQIPALFPWKTGNYM